MHQMRQMHDRVKVGDKVTTMNGLKCVGCHLCILVCPQKAISPGRKRVPKPHY